MTKAFAQIPLSVLTDTRLSHLEIVLYGLILGNFKKEGYCWASNETFGQWLGCSERWVRQSLANLSNYDLLRIDQKSVGGKTERNLFPLVVVEKQEELQFQSRRNYSSSNNTSSLKRRRVNKKFNNFYSLHQPTGTTGTEQLKNDIIFKATDGLYDAKSLTTECRIKWPDLPKEKTPLYQEILKLLTNG